MLTTPEGLGDFDRITCNGVTVGENGVMVEDLAPHCKDGSKVVYVSSQHPDWMDVDGTVADNCPRNLNFDTGLELGCFSCAQSNISYGNGNYIIVAPRRYDNTEIDS